MVKLLFGPIVVAVAWLALSLATTVYVSAQQPSTTPPRFQQADRNGDGRLSRDEVNGPAFDEMDSDKSGDVTVAEAVQWAQRTGFGQSGNRRPAAAAAPQATNGRLRIERNLDYAGDGSAFHRLDLIIPVAAKGGDGSTERARDAHASKPPLVVYVHGGGWESGNRDAGRRFLTPVLETGRYAAASIEYRLSGEAIWPAQIHDCKAAIRWLRAHADEYGYDAEKVAVVGESAGGHLVAMLGVTGGDPSMEGTVGRDHTESSQVQCVVNFFGPSDLKLMGDAVGYAASPISKLLGGNTKDKAAEATQASPVHHVDKDDAPMLIIHGTRDQIVPIDQSENLDQVLGSAGVDVFFLQITGGGHGGFQNREINARAIDFLDHYLLQRPVDIDDSPLSP